MTTITAKVLVASSDKEDTLPAAANPKRASNQPPGQPRPKFAQFTFHALR
jgi:hypothetical protein